MATLALGVASPRRRLMLTSTSTLTLTLTLSTPGYGTVQELSSIYAQCQHRVQGGYYVAEGYIFKEGKLYIPQGTHRKLLVKESHEGGLMAILELIKL